MRNQRLQYYLHDNWDAFRLELAGSLSGDGVQSIEQAWRTALSIIGNRPVIVDITFLIEADEGGRALLIRWHESGARILAASRESRALAGRILGEPFAAPPVKRSWLDRLSAFVFRRSPTAAVILAEAENGHAVSASPRHESDEFNAVSDT